MSDAATPQPPPSPVARRLWKVVGAMALLVATFVVANAWGPGDKSLRAVDLGHDFLAFYTAGTFARQGEFARLYDLVAVQEFEVGLTRQIGVELHGGFMPWWNPPFAALAVEPLTRLPYRTALWAWWATNLACAAVACGLLVRIVRSDERLVRRTGRRAATAQPEVDSRLRFRDPQYSIFHSRVSFNTCALVPALVLLSPAFILSMTHGQNTGVSLMLLAIVVTLWRARRAFAAGLACGLLFYKPQLGALVAVALGLRLGWRAVAGTSVTCGTMLLVTLIAMPGALGAFLRNMPPNLTWFQESASYYWERHATFKAFWRLLLQGHDAGPTSWPVVALWAACTIVLGGALLRVLWWKGPIAEERTIAATIACSPLLMPFYFDYDLLLMAVPIALYAAERSATSAVTRDRLTGWTTAAWATLTAYMIVHPHVADATNVNGNVLILSACAGLTIAHAWPRPATADAIATEKVPQPIRAAA